MRLFENANYAFIPNKHKAYVVSGVLILLSVISLLTFGLETGIDFQGGTELVIEADEPLDVVQVRGSLAGVLGAEPEVKLFGSPNDILVRTTMTGEMQEIQALVLEGVRQSYPNADLAVIKTDTVGPRFADDLRRGAFYAVLASLLVIFVYIMIRFTQVFPFRKEEMALPLGAVVALAHDVIITLGIISMVHQFVPFSLQMDQTMIAAMLTVVGYGLNDTVVVFDRVREYTNIFKTTNYAELVNNAVNGTLSRTVVTSVSTLLVVVVLFIFGGEVLRGFAFALILGIVIGTYSSIFIASAVAVEMKKNVSTV